MHAKSLSSSSLLNFQWLWPQPMVHTLSRQFQGISTTINAAASSTALTSQILRFKHFAICGHNDLFAFIEIFNIYLGINIDIDISYLNIDMVGYVSHIEQLHH